MYKTVICYGTVHRDLVILSRGRVIFMLAVILDTRRGYITPGKHDQASNLILNKYLQSRTSLWSYPYPSNTTSHTTICSNNIKVNSHCINIHYLYAKFACKNLTVQALTNTVYRKSYTEWNIGGKCPSYKKRVYKTWIILTLYTWKYSLRRASFNYTMVMRCCCSRETKCLYLPIKGLL